MSHCKTAILTVPCTISNGKTIFIINYIFNLKSSMFYIFGVHIIVRF